MLPLSALLAAGVLPGATKPSSAFRPAWALVAGVALGVGTYGFHALRLQLPATLFMLLVLFPAHWRQVAAESAGRRSMWLLAAGFMVPFAPMAWVSAMDPDSLKRWEMTRLWPTGARPEQIAALIAERWLMHFSPDFLFQHGDHYSVLNPARKGALSWLMLPGLVAGVAVLALRAWRDPKARLGLALLMLYPLGDLVSVNDGVHSLRSSAGLPALALVIGVGYAEMAGALGRRSVAAAATFVIILAFGMVGESAAFLRAFFVTAPASRQVQIEYQAALLEAAAALRTYEAGRVPIYCTTTGMNQPFVIVAIGAGYDAARWQTDPKDIVAGTFDSVRRFGHYHFLFDRSVTEELTRMQADGRPQRVVFVVRPGELGLQHPLRTIRSPSGEEMLWICEETL